MVMPGPSNLTVRGVSIAYDLLGEVGPTIVLTPSGQTPGLKMRPFAEQILAASGRR
jgi:hypothetical protein